MPTSATCPRARPARVLLRVLTVAAVAAVPYPLLAGPPRAAPSAAAFERTIEPLARLFGLRLGAHARFRQEMREAASPSPAPMVAEASRLFAAGDPVRTLEVASRAAAILRNPFYASLTPGNRLGYWATAAYFIGQSQRVMGRSPEAMAAYGDTLALGRAGLRLDPSNTALRGLIAASLLNMGTMRGDAGDAAGATRYLREARLFVAGLLDADETNRDLQHMLASTDRSIGDLLRRAGDLKGGLAAFRAARARESLLAELDPNDADAWLNQARNDSAIADILEVSGDHAGALISYSQARDALIDFRGEQTTLVPWRFALAEALAGIGTVQEGLGKTGEALAAFSEAREIFQALVPVPNNQLALRALGSTDMHLAMLHEKAGELAAATEGYRDALDAFTTLTKRDARDDDALRRLMAAFGRLAATQIAAGDQTAALATYREAREQIAAVSGEHADPRLQRNLAYFTFQIGRLLTARRDASGALSALRESLRLFQAVSATAPTDAELSRNVWTVGGDLGVLLQQRGDLAGALAAYRTSATALVRAGDRSSKDPLVQRAFDVSADRIGSVGYLMLLARDFHGSLSAEEFALTLTPDAGWLAGNRAHALMFLGRTREARAIYLGRKDKWPDGRSWEDGTRADFAEMRKAGLHAPLMEEVEKAFSASR